MPTRWNVQDVQPNPGIFPAVLPTSFQGRYDGGAPPSGHHIVGDWTLDVTTPAIWICSVAGSPGTFVSIIGGDIDNFVASVTNTDGTITIGGTAVNPVVSRAAITGDVAIPAASDVATLATVNAGPGTTGDSTHVAQVTTNGKGLVTSQSAVAISASGIGAVTSVTADETSVHSTGGQTPVVSRLALTGDITSPSGSAATTLNNTANVKTVVAAVMDALGTFGDGSDGVVTFDGTTTYAAFATTTGVAPNLVYTLTRDVFSATGSGSSAGVTVNSGGMRVFCNGTFTHNGIYQNNGGNASGANNSVGGIAATKNTTGGGNAGATGVTGAGVEAGAPVNPSPNGSATVSAGGAGGAGGTAGGTAGGISRPSTSLPIVDGGPANMLHLLSSVITGLLQSASTSGAGIGGAPGGSSGAGDGTNPGGGGGGGGGVATLIVRTLAGTGTISANGGAGGTPTTAAAVMGVGGGGGGGGGFANVGCLTNNFTGTIQALGGTPGNGLNGAGGTGAGNGQVGFAGTTNILVAT